jgi:formylglycine-generating enzyme required for sulfatase activity
VPGVACTAALAGHGRRKQGVCFDGFDGGRGPDMVVIPAPVGARAFAIGRTEVSNGDYSLYCLRSGHCSRTAGLPTYPVTAISLADALAYVEWLSQATGASYRLPADAEWMYAIRAQGGKSYRAPANCVSEVDDNRVRSSTLHAILSGTSNNWGLYNYTGNAQEWVRTGNSVAVRGGAYTDNGAHCRTSRQHSGSADPITGFRVLREIK